MLAPSATKHIVAEGKTIHSHKLRLQSKLPNLNVQLHPVMHQIREYRYDLPLSFLEGTVFMPFHKDFFYKLHVLNSLFYHHYQISDDSEKSKGSPVSLKCRAAMITWVD